MSTPWRIILTVVSIAASIYYVSTDEPQLGLDLEGGTQVVLNLQPRDGRTLNSSDAPQTVEVLRRRVDALGVSEPNIEILGSDRIIVELPGLNDRERAIEVIGRTAQLTFHRVQGLESPQPQTQIPDAAQGATPAPAPAETPPASQSPSTTSVPVAPNTAGVIDFDLIAATTPTTTPPGAPAAPPAPSAAPTDEAPADGSVVAPDAGGQQYRLAPEALSGAGVANATALPPDTQSTSWYIRINFKDDGRSAWTRLTGEAACAPQGDPTRQVAIVLDQQIISAPTVGGGSTPIECNVGITGDETIITGQFTEDEAKNLALLIRGGALPVDVEIASTSVVGPELGDEAISDSVSAVVVGGILTILYILAYYRLMGVLASIALAAYALISFAVLLGLDLVLTLPGIAGFILAIAMATDSNILVYERVKEELDAGRNMKQAGRVGFKNALSAIIDSNATTFIAALTLFFLAVGEVRGFAVTLLVGTAVSIFVTLILLRTLVTGLVSFEWASSRPGALGMNIGKRLRQRLADNPPDLMRWSKQFLAFALIVTILAVSGVIFRGINYGIEFTGGRLLEYSTAQTVDVEAARDRMAQIGFGEAVVQRSGTDDTAIRIPEATPEQIAQITNAMSELGGGEATSLRDEEVSGSFSNELKRQAIIGLIVGVALQLAWVAYRFRWTFGLGAVLAMVHDGLLVFGLWAWLQKPFDAVFLAAMLTIIAFSVNDSVVVFDRIRETRKRRGNQSFVKVVNDACAQTFPRTINISVSALFILAALYFFGGQTLSDFALALVLGIVTGVYSSVFIASTIAVYLERWKPTLTGKMAPGKSRGLVVTTSSPAGTSADAQDTASEGADDGNTEETKASRTRPAPKPRKRKKR